MTERKTEGDILSPKRRPSRCCEYCGGQKPLSVKRHPDFDYHLEVRIDKDMLMIDAVLGYKFRKDACWYAYKCQNENVPILTGIRIYCCPICGKLLGERARWASDDASCARCDGNSEWKQRQLLRFESPGVLSVGIDKQRIYVFANLGLEYKGRKDYVSELDEIPINYCPICGDKLPESQEDCDCVEKRAC